MAERSRAQLFLDSIVGALVAGLLSAIKRLDRRRSADFAGFWRDHAVLAREGGTRRFNHPQDGPLHYEQMTFVPTAHPDHKLVMLLPRA